MRLDEKGRCCGRKPIEYKRPPHKFCTRCDRAYNTAGTQIANWAWRWIGDQFVSTKAIRNDEGGMRDDLGDLLRANP